MKILWFLLPVLIWSEESISGSESESFISEYEYGQMLYNNPRGVSCSQCHGKSGEGQVIVQYKKSLGKEAIRGADIRKKTLHEMIKSVNAYHKVMPRYYLTDDEVKAIYGYLQKKNRDYLLSAK